MAQALSQACVRLALGNIKGGEIRNIFPRRFYTAEKIRHTGIIFHRPILCFPAGAGMDYRIALARFATGVNPDPPGAAARDSRVLFSNICQERPAQPRIHRTIYSGRRNRFCYGYRGFWGEKMQTPLKQRGEITTRPPNECERQGRIAQKNFQPFRRIFR